ncbi:hypothetical protein Cde04nite_08780 [Cellulomonas denverensis]|nr:hypothetical protein Cde04nite_08780 [Cellulomonas denverensis]
MPSVIGTARHLVPGNPTAAPQHGTRSTDRYDDDASQNGPGWEGLGAPDRRSEVVRRPGEVVRSRYSGVAAATDE